jgi:hypothetical protein
MSTELKSVEYESAESIELAESGELTNQPASESTALAPSSSDAERRVQRAKERLQHHLAVFDQRARSFAKQTAWIAGMVLLGFVGAAAAASMFRPKPRRTRRGAYYANEPSRGRAVGPALMLAAFGILSRGARSIAAHRMRSYES